MANLSKFFVCAGTKQTAANSLFQKIICSPVNLAVTLLPSLLFLLGLAFGGCATLFQKKNAEILVTANVPGAEVTIDGVNRGTVPLQTQVSHKDDHLVRVAKAGLYAISVLRFRQVGCY